MKPLLIVAMVFLLAGCHSDDVQRRPELPWKSSIDKEMAEYGWTNNSKQIFLNGVLVWTFGGVCRGCFTTVNDEVAFAENDLIEKLNADLEASIALKHAEIRSKLQIDKGVEDED